MPQVVAMRAFCVLGNFTAGGSTWGHRVRTLGHRRTRDEVGLGFPAWLHLGPEGFVSHPAMIHFLREGIHRLLAPGVNDESPPRPPAPESGGVVTSRDMSEFPVISHMFQVQKVNGISKL
jgi:hypothetical protein